MRESGRLLLEIAFVLTLVLGGFLSGCKQQVREGITQEEALDWTDDVVEMWNDADLTIVERVYAHEIVRHDCGRPEDIVGVEDMKKFLGFFFDAFPDLNITIDEMVVAGNRLVQRWTLKGTNTGSMGDMPPTGKTVELSGVSIIHMADGKAVEIWDFYNALDMYAQLGFTIIPPEERIE